MSGKKIKIEFYDESGLKHTVTLEGGISREKMSQVLDYVELMGGSLSNSSNFPKKNISDSKFDRVKRLVIYEFSGKIFNSRDAQVAYFDDYGEKIPLSTISTYLSRLSDKGLLNRGGSSGEWHYALAYKGENTYL